MTPITKKNQIVIDRIHKRIIENPDTGCWEWQGPVNTNGYGRIWTGNGMKYAHRLMYEHHVGPIPEGLFIDHLCRNRICQAPHHMEPVTKGENTLRGDTIAARNKAKTHCDNGHEFNEDNLYNRQDGSRECKTCSLRRAREYYYLMRKRRRPA